MAFPQALLIDLDDTMFPESSYVESGFRAVAQFLEETRDLPADYSFPSMMAFLELEGRGAIFDRIIERFEIRNSEGLVAECVDVYRAHKPNIQAYEGVKGALADLSDRYALALVSNGLPAMQQRKLDSLGFEDFFDAVVFCDAINAPKPATQGLKQALDRLGVFPQDCVFIGDNPNTDGMAASNAGVPYLRVRTERFGHLDMAAPQVSTFSEVPGYLSSHAEKLRL